MKKISKNLIKNYKSKILNIHPSLLPKYGGKGFYGMKVHEAVYANKDKKTGATVHFVDEGYDTGPILIQKAINLKSCEKPSIISAKVLKLEHQIYYESVRLFCESKIHWENNKPLIKE